MYNFIHSLPGATSTVCDYFFLNNMILESWLSLIFLPISLILTSQLYGHVILMWHQPWSHHHAHILHAWMLLGYLHSLVLIWWCRFWPLCMFKCICVNTWGSTWWRFKRLQHGEGVWVVVEMRMRMKISSWHFATAEHLTITLYT